MKKKDIMVIGLALFAMFFGAGNLIFPAFLGMESSTSWVVAYSGYVFADVGLAILATIAAAKCEGDPNVVFEKAGKKFAIVLGSVIMICLGPLLAIPRTGATTFEMGIKPLLGNFNPIVFSIIFFALTLFLSIRPSKVVDIIGQFLTPALFVTILVLIIVGIVNPIGAVNMAPRVQNVFEEGINQGYQTVDAIAAIALSAVVMTSLVQKGYKDKKSKLKVTFRGCLVASVGLIIVYGGLAYLGATISSKYANVDLANIAQTSLIVDITQTLLGKPGQILLAIIIGLACLTTAIGLTSAAADYFSKLSKGKVKYEAIVVIICVFSIVVSNLGVSSIIKFSGPILNVIYPPTIVLVVLNLFKEKINNDRVYTFTTYTSLFISILTVINDLGVNIGIVKSLPLANLGFNWLIPTIIMGVLAMFIPDKKRNMAYEN